MNYKEQKIKYLNSYRDCLSQIQNMEFYMEEIENFMDCIRLEHEDMVKNKYIKLRLMLSIKNKIEKLNGETYKKILIFRYLQFMKWEDISEKMGYSLQHLHRLHNKALEKFEM